MGSAEQRGQGREGKDRVAAKTSEDPGGAPGAEDEHPQAGGALSERAPRAEQGIRGEQKEETEELPGARLAAGNEDEGSEPDRQVDQTGRGAAAQIGRRITRR